MRIAPRQVRGKIRYVLDFGERRGERHRKFFDTEAEALQAMRKAEREIDLAGRWWAALPNSDKQGYIAVLKEMRTEGLHPSDLWKSYREGELICRQRRTLREAIAETIQVKRETGKKKRYVHELEKYLLRFAKDREDVPIEKFGPKDIDLWFASREEAPETRRSNLGRLSSLFGFAARRGYIGSNPCKSAEVMSTDRKPPAILHVKDWARMLKACRKHTPNLLRYLVLAGFRGIRPDELAQMEASNVSVKKRQARVDFHSSKIRAWRIIDLPSNVIEWLKLCPKAHGKVAPARSTLRKARRKLRDALGMGSWPQDVLRHTAASHLLVYHEGDEAKVAALLGTSPRVLHSRYKNGLVTKEEAKKFMALKP